MFDPIEAAKFIVAADTHLERIIDGKVRLADLHDNLQHTRRLNARALAALNPLADAA